MKGRQILKKIAEDEFKKYFEQLHHRLTSCITAQGRTLEGMTVINL